MAALPDRPEQFLVGAGVAAWQELRRRGEHPDGDDNVSDSVKLAAIRDALDRGGVGVKAEVEIIAKPYEQIEELMQMQGGSRGAFRGEPESVTDAIDAAPSDEYASEMLTQSTDGPLDVEVIDADPIHTGRFRAWLRRRLRASFSGDTPPDGLMTYEAATSAAKVRRTQRALPRGRS